jgi:hypothetical protein
MPRGRNFRRKTQKRPKKLFMGRENLGLSFWQIYKKKDKAQKKGNELLVVLFGTKQLNFRQKFKHHIDKLYFSPTILLCQSLKKPNQ